MQKPCDPGSGIPWPIILALISRVHDGTDLSWRTWARDTQDAALAASMGDTRRARWYAMTATMPQRCAASGKLLPSRVSSAYGSESRETLLANAVMDLILWEGHPLHIADVLEDIRVLQQEFEKLGPLIEIAETDTPKCAK